MKSHHGIFVGYSPHSKTYRVFKKSTGTIQEYVHVEFNEKIATKLLAIIDDLAGDIEQLDINAGNFDEQVEAQSSTLLAEENVI